MTEPPASSNDFGKDKRESAGRDDRIEDGGKSEELSNAQASRSTSEDKYRTLFEAMDEGYLLGEVLFDESDHAIDIRFLEANPAAMRLAGRDFTGRRMREIDPHYEEFWYEAYGRVALTGQSVRAEHYAEPHGRWFDFRLSRVGRPEERLVASVFQDITDRKRAEASLRESDARHRLLVQSWAQTTWETDADGMVVADSPSWRAYTGQTLDDWLGYGWLDAIHPDDRAHAERQWRDAIAARGLVDAEFRLRAPHGDWRWTNVRAAPVLDPEGRVEKWVGMTIDIDDRRRAEADLRKSEAKYRTLFETMGQGYCELELVRNAEGRAVDQHYLELNPAFERMFGITVGEAKGRTASEVFPGIDPKWTETFDEIVRAGTPRRFEHQHGPHGDWYEVFVYPTGGNRVVILYEDVSDRKRAQERLRESEERKAFLLKLTDALQPMADAGEIQATTARLLGEHLGVDRAMYAEVDGTQGAETGIIRGQFVRPAATGEQPVQPFPERFVFEPFGAHPMAGRYRGEPLVVGDVASSSDFSDAERAAWLEAGVCAAVVVPLAKSGRLVAEFGVHSSVARAWTDAEVSLVREVAERTWAAAERARAEKVLREGEERQAFLLRLNDELRTHSDEGQIESVALNWIAEELALDRAYITTSDYEKGETIVPSEVRRGDLPPLAGVFRHADFPESAQMVNEGTFVVHDVGTDANLSDHNRRSFEAFQIGAVIGVGLRRGSGDVFWTFAAAMTHPREWTQGEVQLMEQVAERTWAAMARARSDAGLRESEERFRTLAESIEDVFYITDLDRGALEYLSSSYERIWGRPVAELLEDLSSFSSTIHPDDLPIFRRGKAMQERGEPVSTEYRIVRPDGEVRWILDRSFPVGDHAPRRSAGVASDITERIRAESALRDSRERWRTLLTGIPQLVWTAQQAGEWNWASPQWTDFTGQSIEDSYDWGWLDAVHPEDREGARSAWALAAESGRFDVEYRIRKAADGSYCGFQTRATPVRNGDGRMVEWLGTSTDIDETRRVEATMRESEQRFRLIVENARGHAIFNTDPERRITHWYGGAAEVFGWSAGEAVGQLTDITFTPEDRAKDEPAKEFSSAARDGRAPNVRWHIRKDEKRIFIEGITSALRDAEGKLTGFLKIGQDVTERRRAEERQQTLLAELQHRVRNIMAMMRSVARRTGDTVGSVEEYVQHLEGRISAMARTQALLTRDVHAAVDLKNMVLDELQMQAAEPGHYSVNGEDVAVPPKAAEVLGLALHELATNAIKYGALGQADGRVDVGWTMVDGADPPRLRLTWAESRVQLAGQPSRRGFGTELITQRVPYELGGTGTMDYRPTGLLATIEFPLEDVPSILQIGEGRLKGS